MKGTWITMLMIGGALSAGGAAAYFANGYIDKTVSARRAQLDSQYEPERIVVANSDLRPGTFLSAQNVAVRDVPKAFVSSEAIGVDRWSTISGRVLSRPVRSGEPILLSHLAQELSAGFSAQLAEGMRALTFPVDEQSSISGMLAPGDRIDLFFTTTNANETVTLPLLTNVPIIATGVRTATNESLIRDKRDVGSYRTVTVSVTPQDAAKITLAQDAGKITITLRQPQDDQPIRLARMTKSILLNGNPVAKRSAVRRRVEVIIGGKEL
ncbi:MAG TPA: Flp pilus assembly protein CpaB [Steroidobacteraceae bacterium]|nr:Flp pilus assembly protein CpaB [Steroidobacteraceae bacterium]